MHKEDRIDSCILGFASLVVGSVLAIPSIRSKLPTFSISSHGTIICPDKLPSQAAEEPTPQQTSDQALYIGSIEYLTILASIGFSTAGFVIDRKRN